jgi:hypothetical protein
MATPGTQGTPAAAPTAHRAPVQWAAIGVGLAFLLVGVLGFIPGITTNYDMLSFAGHHADARLLGVFEVSVLHNIVHLAFGVVGLALAATFNGARGFLLGSGVVYLMLWLYGLVVDHDSAANFIPLNTADNWLHLGLAVGMLVVGLLVGRTRNAPNDTRHV